jgi:hypothetical protein
VRRRDLTLSHPKISYEFAALARAVREESFHVLNDEVSVLND